MSEPRWRIWIAGQGGQGVSFLSQILCRAALMSQLKATSRSEQQWAIRGGLVSADVLIDQQSFSAAEYSDYNWLIYLHPASRQLKPPTSADARILDAYEYQAYRLAESAGFAQGLNLVMLGVLLAQSEVCPVDAVVWQLRHLLGGDQMAVLPYNLELLEQGLRLGSESQSPLLNSLPVQNEGLPT